MTLHEYKAIDLDRPAVRLIRLLKESLIDDIQCELFEGWIQQLEDGTPYDALSYTWGGTKKNCRITVNGSTMYVTSNLYAALQHLRLDSQDRILWIDAICINQADEEERGHQVRHMSNIYKEAERVIVWLGYGTLESDLAMTFIKRLQEDSMTITGDWRTVARTLTSSEPRMEDTYIQQLRKGMKSMLRHPWFRRIWILQEIANARAATILCGDKAVSAGVFAQTPSLIGLSPEPHCQSILDIMPGPSRKGSWWAKKRDLHTLLLKFRESEATEERDIIYALLGLSSDACKSDILLPNYKKSTKQIIWDTTSFLLSHTHQDSSLYAFLDWTLPKFLDSLDSLKSVVLGVASENGQNQVVNHLLATLNVSINPRDKNFQTPLQRASYKGHTAVVRLLLEKGATIEEADNKRQSPLSLAAANGHEAVVRLLLENGARIEAIDMKGQSPLSLAAANGHEAVVRLLLENGARIEAIDNKGQSPLSLAAANGHEAVVRLLLENGARIEATDYKGQSPLSSAAANGHEAVVRLLLEKGAIIETIDKKDQSPLSLAVTNGHKSLFQLLINNTNDQTRLFWAAKTGEKAVVKAFLEHSKSLESKNNFDQTALSLAAEYGKGAVVQLLLEQGAEIESENYDDRTPLSLAAEMGHGDIVQLLLKNGAKSESNSRNNRTPLSLAAEMGHGDIVQLLLKNGAKSESNSRNNRTPLSLAAEMGHKGIVQLLLDNGAQYDSNDKYSRTPLCWAARAGHEDIVRLLLLMGAELESRDDRYDRTPLSLAAGKGRKAVVRLLIAEGAELESKDSKWGLTPVLWAAKSGHEDVVQLLLAKGATLEPEVDNNCTSR